MKRYLALGLFALTCAIGSVTLGAIGLPLLGYIITPTMDAWNVYSVDDGLGATKHLLAQRLDQIDSQGYDICLILPIVEMVPVEQTPVPGVPGQPTAPSGILITSHVSYRIVAKLSGHPGFQCPGGLIGPGGQPAPTTGPPPPPSAGCVTPDPFVILGGGTCRNGEWLPPGM